LFLILAGVTKAGAAWSASAHPRLQANARQGARDKGAAGNLVAYGRVRLGHSVARDYHFPGLVDGGAQAGGPVCALTNQRENGPRADITDVELGGNLVPQGAASLARMASGCGPVVRALSASEAKCIRGVLLIVFLRSGAFRHMISDHPNRFRIIR